MDVSIHDDDDDVSVDAQPTHSPFLFALQYTYTLNSFSQRVE